MPIRMRRLPGGGYRVREGKKVTARHTTKRNAERQVRLLRGIAAGWRPTRRRAR